MSGPEQSFWKKVRNAWPGHAVRVEASAGGVDPGFPDSILSIDGRGGYVETKVWPQQLEPTQLPWHQDAMRSGAYAVVLCEMPDRKVWLGTAEDYDLFFVRDRIEPAIVLRLRTDRPDGVSLQAALNVVACALTGRAIGGADGNSSPRPPSKKDRRHRQE